MLHSVHLSVHLSLPVTLVTFELINFLLFFTLLRWLIFFFLNYFLFNLFLFLHKSGGGGGPPSALSLCSSFDLTGTYNW